MQSGKCLGNVQQYREEYLLAEHYSRSASSQSSIYHAAAASSVLFSVLDRAYIRLKAATLSESRVIPPLLENIGKL